MIISVHGHEFSIDTDDWTDAESRAIAEDTLIDELRNLTPDQAAQLYAGLKAFDSGECESLPELAQQISQKAFAAGTAGWAVIPSSGHNVEIGIA